MPSTRASAISPGSVRPSSDGAARSPPVNDPNAANAPAIDPIANAMLATIV